MLSPPLRANSSRIAKLIMQWVRYTSLIFGCIMWYAVQLLYIFIYKIKNNVGYGEEI